MGLTDDIRAFIVENYFISAKAQGLGEISLVSGEVHSAMGLSNRMPAVCSALRSGELEQLGFVRLLREVRRPAVKLNSSTNRFEFEMLDSPLDKDESRSLVKENHIENGKNTTNQKKVNGKTLVVVPCGKSKIWKRRSDAGPTKAKDAYTGSPFKVNREYAETFADEWVILSAKYGFIAPDFVIPEDYNVTFGDRSSNPISMECLREQAIQLRGFDSIVALGGTEYGERVKSAFRDSGRDVITPAAGLPIGKAMGKVKGAVRQGKPFGSSAPVEYSERDLGELEDKLGVRFKNKRLLVAAVTRRAYAKELRDRQPDIVREDNERLEFLGDGVLELAVRRLVYDKHDDQEGTLSKMADEFVSDSNLTEVAHDLILEKHLFLGRTEESDERGKPAILADALEAIIGAVYLDQGLKETLEVVEKLILCREV